ncbi:hypothetical protein [Runella salmonicolor]|uniref:Uncharacterized protein n=1 Tax=Runella salmonicolor TaxID=2950278 RepID=A0ABT1FNT3_9BACT|nr:hypothetical protein [Runella salmonicolor]MCP1382233.1 hypothetical protein [Runella salmonicolor]
MNTINFEYIIAYFQGAQPKNLFKKFEAFAIRQRAVFEALVRTGQPFGGKV